MSGPGSEQRNFAYVNGRVLRYEDAMVHISDRGFLFSDGVYEVISVIDGQLVDDGAHLRRLLRSLSELHMDHPISLTDLRSVMRSLIKKNEITEGTVYIQVTRGTAPRDFRFPSGARPTIVMYSTQMEIVNAARAQKGIKLASTSDIRWDRRDIKSVGLLAQVLAKQKAAEDGADEALLFDKDGTVTEGGSSNIFIVDGEGQIITTPTAGNRILAGITRQRVMSIAEENGSPILEKRFSLSEVASASEVFVTGSSMLVLPVVEVDGRPIGQGEPGKTTLKIRELYLRFARDQLAVA